MIKYVENAVTQLIYYFSSLQVISLVTQVLLSIMISLGVGRHIYEIPMENMPLIGWLGNTTGTSQILTAILSKASFAVTLLTFIPGYYRWIVWFLIFTMPLFLGLNAVFIWIRCIPLSNFGTT
jgi:hypothetical protein